MEQPVMTKLEIIGSLNNNHITAHLREIKDTEIIVIKSISTMGKNEKTLSRNRSWLLKEPILFTKINNTELTNNKKD